MSKKSSLHNSEFQTPKGLKQTNAITVSQFKNFQFSQNRQQDNTKNKVTRLIKKIAQLQLRQSKYIQKIKYLETMNIRISRENFDQSHTKNQNSEIQNILKLYQEQLKKLGKQKSSNDQNLIIKDSNLSKYVQDLSKQRQNWIKRYQQLIQKSNKSVEQITHKKLQFEYENKYLKQKLNDLQLKLQKTGKQKYEKNESYQVNSNKDKNLINKIAMLQRQNNQLKRTNMELENQFVKLQKQIQTKFNFLQQQISLYETQKSQNLQKIQALKNELSIRQSTPFFSFSAQQNKKDVETQTENQMQMDINCFKSSIESLLEQNSRLKKSLSLLQNFVVQNNNQLPKELQIQFQLSKSVKK